MDYGTNDVLIRFRNSTSVSQALVFTLHMFALVVYHKIFH